MLKMIHLTGKKAMYWVSNLVECGQSLVVLTIQTQVSELCVPDDNLELSNENLSTSKSGFDKTLTGLALNSR